MIEVSEKIDQEAALYKSKSNTLAPESIPQQTFLALPSSIFEGGYGGTAGTGKTFSLVTLPLFKQCHNIRGFYGKIWRRSYPQIQESLEPESQKWYPHFGFTYNSQDHSWTNKDTKAKIDFGFLDRDSDALKHDSAQYHYLAFEECTQFTRFMYNYLLHRCRSDISGWTAICRNDATPGDIGNTWYRKHFVEPAREGYRVIEGEWFDIKTGKRTIVKRIFIRAHEDDSKHILAVTPDYYDRMEMLPEALKRAKRYGDFWAFQGQVFEEFRSIHLEGEPEQALHVIPAQPIPDWWPKIVAIDWGYRHGNYVIWGAVSPEGKLIIYREDLCNFESIKIWGARVKYLSQHDGNIVRVVADPMTRGHFGDERSILEQIADATGWQVDLADNDRIGGKALLHELFRWTNRTPLFEPRTDFDSEYAQKLLRIKGLEPYQQYVKQFEPDKTLENLPKTQIFDSCPALIDCIQSLIYDEGEGRARQKAEDVKKSDGDDPYDGFRYLAKAYEQFIEGASTEWQNRCKVAEAVGDYQRTRDYVAYASRMDSIEKDQSEVIQFPKYPRLHKHSRIITH